MNGRAMLQAYFSLKQGKAPNLPKLEQKLQPPGTKIRKRNTWQLALAAIVLAGLMFMLFRRVIPIVSEQVPQLLSSQPAELQLVGIFLVLPALAGAVGYGIYRLFSRLARQRAMEVYLESIHDAKKLMVYVSGSGAIGFTKAVERISQGKPIRELLVFAHPPVVAIKKGSIRLMGAVTAYAPVQYAMGSHKAARSARIAEGDQYSQGHQAFLEATGSKETAVEWSMIHLGKGHTSITCHTEWETARTTTGYGGAKPKRFVVLVRDSTFEDSILSNEKPGVINTDVDASTTSIQEDIAPVVVRVRNDGVVGSGVVIDTDGLVITNAHVVKDAESVTVRFGDGTESTAIVAERDTDADVALLSCIGVNGATSVQRGDSSTLNHGDLIAAFGYPADKDDQGAPTVDMGVVTKFFSENELTHIQSSVSVSPGCSGGPLVTLDGRFVGLITSTHTDTEADVKRTLALSSNDVFSVISNFNPTETMANVAD